MEEGRISQPRTQDRDDRAAPRVALVHDFLLDIRGAERVFAAIYAI